MTLPRRLLFGEVADLYDTYRPSYPVGLIDDLVELGGVARGTGILEVGAGTGKATVLLAARGARVIAVEPSAAMARIARRNCAAYPGVEIVESDFEQWDPADATFPLLYSAQAWHWMAPEVRYQRARRALRPGGVLAVFWNRPAWGASPVREALREVYAHAAPDLKPTGPTHPANENPDGDERWEDEIAAADGFAGAQERHYGWSIDYSAEQYAGMLTTLSEIRLLGDVERDQLLRGVAAVIDEHGGRFTLELRTRLCLARAV